MSAASSPVDVKLPHRSSTMMSSATGGTRRASMSDDEAIPGTDSNETTNLLMERLRAWKHMCANLEDYVATTAKVQRSISKDYERVLKTVQDPLREGHHFSQSVGGVSSFFENVRSNTQGIVNLYLDGERNLKGSVLPALEKLHKDVKLKSKELHSGASKGAKAVEKARGITQKHIELLASNTAALDAASGNKVETANDPYILRRGVVHRLNKQVIEENNSRQDIIAVQNNFQQFEAHVLQTVQTVIEQLVNFMGGQSDRQRAMYTDMLGSLQRIPPDFEWVNFITRNDSSLVDPDAPPRNLANITFPNQDHRTTTALIEGSLERKSRAVLKGFSSGHYVVTPARYLHEFKDTDDLRRDPSPELSLYLPDCLIGAVDGAKFTIKGKDVSSSVVVNAFHTNTDFTFKAGSSSEAEKWLDIMRGVTKPPVASPSSASVASPVSPASPPEAAAAAAAAATSPAIAQPPAYLEKEKEPQTPVSPIGVIRTDTAATASSLGIGTAEALAAPSPTATSPAATSPVAPTKAAAAGQDEKPSS